MAQAFTPGLKLLKNAVIQKTRELPLSGEIIPKVGDKVKSSDVVAKADLPGELYILRLPEKMGINSEEVMEGLKVKVGDRVKAGQPLCEYSGFFGLLKSRFLAPEEGTIEFITERTAHIGLRMDPSPLEVKAYISGEVIGVNQGRSLTIESHGALVQGIFGIGGERLGSLRVLNLGLGDVLDDSKIPEQVKDAIVVGGTNPTITALNKLNKLGAIGAVVGSIDDQTLAAYLGYDLGIALTGDEDVPTTIIITEGFGNIAMSDRIYNLLKHFDGQMASINGATQVRAGAVRPEIIVCHSGVGYQDSDQSKWEEGLGIGRLVRIIRVPYFGQQGKVIELPNEIERIETGALTRVARVEIQAGNTVTVPRANLELI